MTLSSWLLLLFGNIIVNNIVLTKYLGCCPFLGTSQNPKSAVGMGLAVVFVVTGASIFTYALYYGILVPFELEYLELVTFIMLIASFVQFVEIFIKKYFPQLYKSLGIYLPLITTNCCVLYVALNNIENGYGFAGMLANSLGVSIGFMALLYIFSMIRQRLDAADTPSVLKGNPISLITIGIMAMAIAGLAGVM